MRKGFTLIELMIAIALMTIMVGIYFVTVNPGQQISSARNATRKFQIQSIINAVRQNIADQSTGQFSCASGPLPTSSAIMTSAAGAGNYDIATCIILPSGGYGLFSMPFDPSASGTYWNSASDYNSGYTIVQNASGSITVAAPYSELGKLISVSR